MYGTFRGANVDVADHAAAPGSMSTFSFRQFVIPWIESLRPTAAGVTVTLRNPWVVLRRRGSAVLTNGVKMTFDRTSRADVLNLVTFSIGSGTALSSVENPIPGSFVVDSARKEVTTPSGLTFCWDEFNSTIFAETFLHDVHFVDYDLSGKVVVEGGAFVGDTGLYYASKGARVYSFEPNQTLFELLKHNVDRNPQVPGSVTPCHAAIGRDGTIQFPTRRGGAGSVFRGSAGTEAVTSLSLGSILARFNITQPYLLHLDIKGLETEVVTQKELADFQRVMIEYETVIDRKTVGSYQSLIDSLTRHGFTKLRTYKHNANRFDLRTHGTVDASK